MTLSTFRWRNRDQPGRGKYASKREKKSVRFSLKRWKIVWSGKWQISNSNKKKERNSLKGWSKRSSNRQHKFWKIRNYRKFWPRNSLNRKTNTLMNWRKKWRKISKRPNSIRQRERSTLRGWRIKLQNSTQTNKDRKNISLPWKTVYRWLNPSSRKNSSFGRKIFQAWKTCINPSFCVTS